MDGVGATDPSPEPVVRVVRVSELPAIDESTATGTSTLGDAVVTTVAPVDSAVVLVVGIGLLAGDESTTTGTPTVVVLGDCSGVGKTVYI